VGQRGFTRPPQLGVSVMSCAGSASDGAGGCSPPGCFPFPTWDGFIGRQGSGGGWCLAGLGAADTSGLRGVLPRRASPGRDSGRGGNRSRGAPGTGMPLTRCPWYPGPPQRVLSTACPPHPRRRGGPTGRSRRSHPAAVALSGDSLNALGRDPASSDPTTPAPRPLPALPSRGAQTSLPQRGVHPQAPPYRFVTLPPSSLHPGVFLPAVGVRGWAAGGLREAPGAVRVARRWQQHTEHGRAPPGDAGGGGGPESQPGSPV